tara:strand:+ start:246 stop:680 length:435 start_codon:yes stop_codon:yes gene_type:complete
MGKISTYAVVTPVATDKVIGTDVDSSGATKNFTMQSIADLAAMGGYVYPRFNVVATALATSAPSAGDFVLISIDNHTCTLPTAVGITGKIIGAYQATAPAGVTNITIATTGAETINGAASKYLATQYSKYLLMSDGANWVIIGD